MPRTTLVPITPAVLSWAIEESGYTRPEISERLKVDLADLRAWESGRSKPGLGAFRSLARILRRQTAVFLLPEPPEATLPKVELRGPPGHLRSALNPDERKFVRQVVRIQGALSWVARESGDLADSRLPTFAKSDDPAKAASAIRAALGIDLSTQLGWEGASVALDAWRKGRSLPVPTPRR